MEELGVGEEVAERKIFRQSSQRQILVFVAGVGGDFDGTGDPSWEGKGVGGLLVGEFALHDDEAGEVASILVDFQCLAGGQLDRVAIFFNHFPVGKG